MCIRDSIATIIPIYFNFLAEEAGLSNVQYLAYWGYAASAATLLVAVLGPVFGTLADTQGYKKPIFLLFLGVGLIGCIALGFAAHWLWFLLIFVVARVGYSGSLIFYDSKMCIRDSLRFGEYADGVFQIAMAVAEYGEFHKT